MQYGASGGPGLGEVAEHRVRPYRVRSTYYRVIPESFAGFATTTALPVGSDG